MFRKVAQPFYTLYVVITFLCTILIVFPFVIILGAFDSDKTRRVICNIIKGWSYFWLAIIGMPLQKRGKKPPRGKYVIVANHISYIDSILLFSAIPGYFRPLGKKEISHIPLIGILYKQIVIMVDRSSHTSRTKSMRLMWRVLKNGGNIVIFPEGTFNETGAPLKDFYDGAFRLALNTHADLLPIILPDTVKRWHYSAWWKLSPGRNRAIYLSPVSTKDLEMSDLPLLKQRVHSIMEDALVNANLG